jgi:hypothetical protein
MFISKRKKRGFGRKILSYILLLSILGLSAYFVNFFITFGKPLYVSPVGKISNDRLAFEKELNDRKIYYSIINMEGNYYIVRIQNNGEVRISLEKNINEQLDSLQKILRELTIEGKLFRSIDFRFAEPVILF